jgi:magnesium chelatase subunit I
MTPPTTLGDLKQTEWSEPRVHLRSVKEEMRHNLICMLEAGHEIFPGIVGYEETVVPHVINAVLARHNFILLGLRGQAKSRILRQLVTLLDEEIPILAGSEVNDNPFRPISKFGRQIVEEHGDRTPIEWIPRHRRYVEKLATPDVTIADMIGDVDPIKAARGGHLLSDELTIHYGLLPRSNRGIFAINELPDLAGKIQVGLFNIMQEGDVQIKGYPIRLALDVLLVFSANPEDYTARGKIITPLKDRVGSEILTHYPPSVEHGMEITQQEAWLERDGRALEIPDFIRELVERVAFEAREDKRIDRGSGVSQRLPISVLENVLSSAEQRSIVLKEKQVVPRVSDVYDALPAITGKIELEYEGELQGAERRAEGLRQRALRRLPQGILDGARPARRHRADGARSAEGPGHRGGGMRAGARGTGGASPHFPFGRAGLRALAFGAAAIRRARRHRDLVLSDAGHHRLTAVRLGRIQHRQARGRASGMDAGRQRVRGSCCTAGRAHPQGGGGARGAGPRARRAAGARARHLVARGVRRHGRAGLAAVRQRSRPRARDRGGDQPGRTAG